MPAPAITEACLKLLWQNQRLPDSSLRTIDGRSVTILSRGGANDDGGPDFIDASIRIGGILYRGDVEVHRNAGDWLSHTHHTDPHYNRTILHVVHSCTIDPRLLRSESGRIIPLLELHSWLQQDHDGDPRSQAGRATAVPMGAIRCAQEPIAVPPEVISQWIESLGMERIDQKISRFEERLLQLIEEREREGRDSSPPCAERTEEIPYLIRGCSSGSYAKVALWEQVLYEAMMECLGYAKNRTPFRSLAQNVRLASLTPFGLDDVETMMAILFGAAGLLPPSRSLPELTSRNYVRRLQGRWTEVRPAFRVPLLHEADWLFFRLHPGNFPTARLASMCLLLPVLFGPGGFRSIIRTLSEAGSFPAQRITMLQSFFTISPDAYWQTHLHFASLAGPPGVRLGSARVHEVVVNVIIPIVKLYARVFEQPLIDQRAEEVLRILPPGHHNRITRMVQRVLLRNVVPLSTALRQQGVLHLHRSYCLRSRCSECIIGKRRPNAGTSLMSSGQHASHPDTAGCNRRRGRLPAVSRLVL
jgi:hypothetical protein